METITSRYVCPTCHDHPVEVTSAGFGAGEATVSGCPTFGGFSPVVPLSTMLDWQPWGSQPAVLRHADGLVVFASA